MAKQTSRQVAASPAKIKTAISLSPRAWKRLGGACVYYDKNQSELLEEKINEWFGGIRVVNDHAKSSASVVLTDRLDVSHEVNPPALAAQQN
jgi:hypothetical protein